MAKTNSEKLEIIPFNSTEIIAEHFASDKSNLKKIFCALETINKIKQGTAQVQGVGNFVANCRQAIFGERTKDGKLILSLSIQIAIVINISLNIRKSG